jgi:hypothetical protein
MVKKKYTKKSQHAEVEQELKNESPIVVRFFKIGCPACEMSEPAWNNLDMPKYRMVAVEQEAIPPEVLKSISAFPTYAAHDKKGNRHVKGAILDPSQIKVKLNL